MYSNCLYGEPYEKNSTGCHIVDEKNEEIERKTKENANLKQALNEIREMCTEEVKKGTFDTNDDEEYINVQVKKKCENILQIVDNILER